MKTTALLSALLFAACSHGGSSDKKPESKPTSSAASSARPMMPPSSAAPASAPASMPASSAAAGKVTKLKSGATVTIPDGTQPGAGPTSVFVPSANALMDVSENLVPDCAAFLQKEYDTVAASAKNAAAPTQFTKVEWRQVAGEKAFAADGVTKSKDGSGHPISTVETCHGKSGLTITVSQKSGATLDAAGRSLLDSVVASVTFPK